MADQYLRTLLTPNARSLQRHYYDRSYPDLGDTDRDEELGERELAFLAARDSFYLATVTETGWPYIQHRGGPAGFLVARSPTELAFADYGGNRQLLSVTSIAAERRVSLFLVDYARRRRLKILGLAEVLDAREHPDLIVATAPSAGHAAAPERIVRIRVHASDWNCPQFLTPRFSRAEFDAVVDPLRQRIAGLEAELAELRARR